jgi:hypothetical protein
MSSPFEEWFKRKRPDLWLPKLDDVRREIEIVYEYFVKLGKDGKPILRKFGNVHSSPLFLGGGLNRQIAA